MATTRTPQMAMKPASFSVSKRMCDSRRRVASLKRHLTGASTSSVRSRVSTHEWAARVSLAAAYRISARFGWDEWIYNHITLAVRDPGQTKQERFLINPFGMRFSEITASSLVTVDLDGNVLEPGSSELGINLAGFVIHSAIHAARHDIGCLFHNHLDEVVAVASHKQGLLPLSQESCIIWPKLAAARHTYEGIATDMAERTRLLASLGPAPSKVLFLKNHGALIGGADVASAFWNTHTTVRACQLQCKALQSVAGDVSKLELVAPRVVKDTGARLQAGMDEAGEAWGVLEWRAVMRTLRKEEPDFEE